MQITAFLIVSPKIAHHRTKIIAMQIKILQRVCVVISGVLCGGFRMGHSVYCRLAGIIFHLLLTADECSVFGVE